MACWCFVQFSCAVPHMIFQMPITCGLQLPALSRNYRLLLLTGRHLSQASQQRSCWRTAEAALLTHIDASLFVLPAPRNQAPFPAMHTPFQCNTLSCIVYTLSLHITFPALHIRIIGARSSHWEGHLGEQEGHRSGCSNRRCGFPLGERLADGQTVSHELVSG